MAAALSRRTSARGLLSAGVDSGCEWRAEAEEEEGSFDALRSSSSFSETKRRAPRAAAAASAAEAAAALERFGKTSSASRPRWAMRS